MNCFLGVDLGTSGVKVLALDENGNVVASSKQNISFILPSKDFVEQDLNEWWALTCKAIKEVLSKIHNVKCVGFSGQMHGLIALDDKGEAIGNAVIWLDKRSIKECEDFKIIIGEDNHYKITGSPISTGMTGTSLLWLKKNRPEIFLKVKNIILPKDYLRYKLTGEIATDFSDASGTLLFDIEKRKWSESIIKELGFDISIFPNILNSFDAAGKVSKKASLETGLKEGTLVALGGADQIMASIGNGVIDDKKMAITLGTGGQIYTVSKEIVKDEKNRFNIFAHAKEDYYMIMAASLSGGVSINWFNDIFLDIEKERIENINGNIFEYIEKEIKDVEAGSKNLIFLPYLSGERTPHLNPFARGSFIGIDINHEKKHFIKSVFEGVAFSMRECLELFKYFNIEYIISSGGTSESKAFNQIQSDIYNRELYVTNRKEHSAYGAALVAQVCFGLYKSIDEACLKNIEYKRYSYPIEENVIKYEKLYKVYKECYTSLKNIFYKLHECD